MVRWESASDQFSIASWLAYLPGLFHKLHLRDWLGKMNSCDLQGGPTSLDIA